MWAMAFGAMDLAVEVANTPPGGIFEIPDGNYANVVLALKASGRPGAPTRLVAKNPGHVFLTGDSALKVEASDVVVSGFGFKEGGIPQGLQHVVEVRGDRVVLEDLSVAAYNQGGRGKQWVILFGSSNRVTHCAFSGKTTVDPTFQVEIEESRVCGTLVERCYFGPRPPLGKNGGETIRIGYSKQAWFEAGVVVRENLFEACDGELEIISGKSCGNWYVSNTFLECAGALTLRHGNHSTVRGNVFMGKGKKETAGIRVIGANHLIEGNHFEGLTKDLGAIALTAAQENFVASGYWTVSNVRVEGNSFALGKIPAVVFSSMLGGKEGSQKVLPRDCLFISNRWAGEGPAFGGTMGSGHRFIGDLARELGANPPTGVGLFPGELGEGGRPQGMPALHVMARGEVGPRW